jgi:predicted HTH domain antitoxin
MADMLSIPLSPELTEALQSVGGAARERLAVSLFREGRLNHLELSKVLELDRFEIDAVLKRHQVTTGALTLNDLEMDRAVLDRVLGPAKK